MMGCFVTSTDTGVGKTLVSAGLLHALAAGEDWRVSLLVDEAHHLADRAREMYSATLDERRLAHARR